MVEADSKQTEQTMDTNATTLTQPQPIVISDDVIACEQT